MLTWEVSLKFKSLVLSPNVEYWYKNGLILKRDNMHSFPIGIKFYFIFNNHLDFIYLFQSIFLIYIT